MSVLIGHASIAEGGGVYGKPGDQTGREVGISVYYNYPWDCVLRYEGEAGEDAPGTVTVRPGDTLWAIAEKYLGNGLRYKEIMALNNLSSTLIHPGQVLRLPVSGGYVTLTATVRESTLAALKALAAQQGRTVGEVLDRTFGP